MQYNTVLIFTKKGNLLKFLQTDRIAGRFSNPNSENVQQHYGKEREIQLIACIRWEEFQVSTSKGYRQVSKCFCKIKCPVNPLPVKGEFEIPSIEVLHSFLKADGWELKQKIHSWMFQ